MTSSAVTHASSYAQVRVREPAGERIFGETLTIGGLGARVVVPGAGSGCAVQIERRDAIWVAQPVGGTQVRFDGLPLASARDLRRHDVLALGDSQIIVTDVSRTLLRIDVCHLIGNTTVCPAGAVSALAIAEGGDEDVEIRAHAAPVAPSAPPTAPPTPPEEVRRRRLGVAAVAVALLIAVGVALQLVPVALDIEPGDAHVRVPGTMLALHVGERLLLLPGDHLVRAERRGYESAGVSITVSTHARAHVRLHLIKLPGTLQIDTGGIASIVSIDGVESGRAPGVIIAPSGEHTIAIRAPRYVDYIAPVRVEGALVRQRLKVALQPSWGTLQISAIPAGAQISVDGAETGKAPAVVDAPSGVRRVRISAPGLKTWESSVVLRAGEALNIGPITLGQPDAHLVLSSEPSGAEVTIAGTLRGRTPMDTALPAGIEHEVAVNFPGYATWTKAVFAEAGRRIALTAHLEVVGARVTVEGQPDDAQLLVDGVDRGRTPQSLLLSTVEHHIEVRKEGWASFAAAVTPAPGLDRTVRYQLGAAEHSVAPEDVASTLYTQTGYLLRLAPVTLFAVRGDERPQAPRQGGGLRQLTLKRPFYLGVAEITNEQFRRFRPNHDSGSGRHSPGLDEQPVTQVSWDEAAAFCNWLSEQDSLPPAYVKGQDRYVLRRPVTIGYRLPTLAEWTYAGRYALPFGLHDLSGTLSEWVNDYYEAATNATPVTDPLGPGQGTRHVLVSGAGSKSSAGDQRFGSRDGDAGSPTLAFRVARYAQ